MEKFSRIPLSLPFLPSRMSRSHERGVDRVVSKTSAKVTPVQSILRHIEPHLFALLESPEYPPTWSTIFHSSPLPSIPTCLSSATPQSPRNPPLTKRATRRWGGGGGGEGLLSTSRQKTSRSTTYRKHDWDCYPWSDRCTSTLLQKT